MLVLVLLRVAVLLESVGQKIGLVVGENVVHVGVVGGTGGAVGHEREERLEGRGGGKALQWELVLEGSVELKVFRFLLPLVFELEGPRLVGWSDRGGRGRGRGLDWAGSKRQLGERRRIAHDDCCWRESK